MTGIARRWSVRHFLPHSHRHVICPLDTLQLMDLDIAMSQPEFDTRSPISGIYLLCVCDMFPVYFEDFENAVLSQS